MKHKKKIIAGVVALALAIGISFVLSGASTAGGEAKEENSAGTQSLTVLSASANVPSGVWYEDAALWCEDQGDFYSGFLFSGRGDAPRRSAGDAYAPPTVANRPVDSSLKINRSVSGTERP